MFRFILCFIIIFCFLTSGIYLFLLIYVGKIATKDTKKHSDGILVLGAKAYHGKSYNPCLVARVTHATDLYKSGYASKVVFSGGYDREDNVSEAETMKTIALGQGVKEQDIFLEKESTSTFENFVFSQNVLRSAEIHSVILVTEPFHMARASLVAKKMKYNFSVSPVTNSPCWLPFRYISHYSLKEPLAIIQYALKKRL